MNDKILGFVLSQSDYREYDLLMQVATKEYGILSLIGKAAKKVNSKNHFLPFCEYEFIIDYKDGKSIYDIHGYKIIQNYFADNDIRLMSFKSIICELALKNRDINTYDQVLLVFEKMKDDDCYLPGSLFLSYLIKHFGITPIVDGCAICGNQKVLAVSNRQGGFLCEKHIGSEIVLQTDRLKKFRWIIKANFDNYEALKDCDYDFYDFELLMNFFMDNSDLRINSYDFYKALI